MIKTFPCKVTEVSTAKPGKHGSAKVILKGKDILTGKQYECTYHSGDMVDAPIVKRNEYDRVEIIICGKANVHPFIEKESRTADEEKAYGNNHP